MEADLIAAGPAAGVRKGTVFRIAERQPPSRRNPGPKNRFSGGFSVHPVLGSFGGSKCVRELAPKRRAGGATESPPGLVQAHLRFPSPWGTPESPLARPESSWGLLDGCPIGKARRGTLQRDLRSAGGLAIWRSRASWAPRRAPDLGAATGG